MATLLIRLPDGTLVAEFDDIKTVKVGDEVEIVNFVGGG